MAADRMKEVLRAALLKQDGGNNGYTVVYNDPKDERLVVIDGRVNLDELAKDILFALSL